ncbi:MAG TPA: TetR/AcrR family transcriptional regulator [Melioribacteraceae bacterium]|nr:TetR/AcrR family transcriptional regulator [Melioribacteraceae bacterium]
MKYPNTKKLIIENALDYFSTNGYAGASIRQIARAVGIRESAIYNHFNSKEDIFLAILSEFKSKSLSDKILNDELLDELDNPEKFLHDFALKLIGLWNTPRERKFIRLLLMEQFTKVGSTELSITEYINELRNICRLIFSEMIKNNIARKYDPSILAEQFTAPLFLIRTEYLAKDEGINIDKVSEMVRKHVSFFWNSVKV